jgi:dihydroneopterin aldolase
MVQGSASPEVLGPGFVRMMIRDVRLNIRIGVHPWEREAPQPVVVNVEMFARDRGRRSGEGLESVVDYDYVRDALLRWEGRPQVDLLETLLEELAQVCFHDPKVEACRISIVKPDIFPESGGAGVELFRLRKA